MSAFEDVKVYNTHYRNTNSEAWSNYRCPHCLNRVTGAVLAFYFHQSGGETKWLQCPSCQAGAVEVDGVVSPGVPSGDALNGLPHDVEKAYDEARLCHGVGAYTATELLCRKVLMHTAVDKGAPENQQFVTYVDYLDDSFMAPPMKDWVDQIRKNGNQSTHEIPSPDVERSRATLSFTTQLLRTIYEMPHIYEQTSTPAGGSA